MLAYKMKMEICDIRNAFLISTDLLLLGRGLGANAFGLVGHALGRFLLFFHEYRFKLASFKGDQRPNPCNAASRVGSAVLAHVARSGRLDAALR